MKDPHAIIARWMGTFAEYDFDIAYRPGSKNAGADYLMRPTYVEGIVLHVSLGSQAVERRAHIREARQVVLLRLLVGMGRSSRG